MTNEQVCVEFVKVLLESPLTTMQCIQMRLSATNYELRLLRADPLKEYEEKWDEMHSAERGAFPLQCGERGRPFSD